MANWTDDELRASVDAYLAIRKANKGGKPLVKSHVYADLAKRFPPRAAAAFERRMQNISHVFTLMGREWTPGLRPAANVGANVVRKLERLISEAEGVADTGTATFAADVAAKIDKPLSCAPAGVQTPAKVPATATQYTRDPAVVAWVLNQAGGRCECCGGAAPFKREDGSPFLEVHHVEHLADGGPDIPANAAAVCPNCHRELHHGIDRADLAAKLRQSVAERGRG